MTHLDAHLNVHLDMHALGLTAIDPAMARPRHAAHLKECGECRDALDALREFDAALREPESWIGLSEAAPPAGNDELRAFAVRAEREDAEALLLLDEFREPAAAARFVWADVATNREFQTGGVARLLCKWANGMCQRNPLYALKLAEAATAIADGLPDGSYPRNTIHELRGEARKEEANAFYFLGRFSESVRALASAEAEYMKFGSENAGLVSVQYIRGLIHYERDEFDAAEQLAHEAADAALLLGHTDRYMNARHLLGYVLFDRHQYTAAAENFLGILRYGQANGSKVWIAHESLAIGLCYIALGRLSEARRYLYEALRIYTDLCFGPDVARTNWAIGRLIFAEGGNTQEAIYRLRTCITELTDFQNATDAALVAIDLAEILNAAGRTRDVPKLLFNVVRTFMDAGKIVSALTALAYLKDAARNGTMTPRIVTYVRHFIRHADRQPELLFAPPPS